MCPLHPFHSCLAALVIIFSAASITGLSLAEVVPLLKVTLSRNGSVVPLIDLEEGEHQVLDMFIERLPQQYSGELLVEVTSSEGLDHVSVFPHSFHINDSLTSSSPPEELKALYGSNASFSAGRFYQDTLNVSGSFIGFSKLRLVLSDGANEEEFLQQTETIPIKVRSGKHVIDKIFVHVVILLVVMLYINMGCAIDLAVIRQTIRRPLAPLIGLMCQYTLMPLFAYFLGYLFLSNSPSLWLGLFVTGCSPGGGGSNMWTYLLGGSLDLSVTMTFFSTLFAFVMMPFWLWLLGDTIYSDADLSSPPYRNIAMLLVGLILPISIGLLIQRFLPRVSAVLVKLLKPAALIFLIFVMTFGIYAYWYIFKFFTWQVAISGLGLPWLGFAAGFLISVLTNRSSPERIAISIETGLQNTGLAIGLLKVALKPYAPLGDIAIVVPIAVATLTPLPLLSAYLLKCYRKKGKEGTNAEFMNLRGDSTMEVM